MFISKLVCLLKTSIMEENWTHLGINGSSVFLLFWVRYKNTCGQTLPGIQGVGRGIKDLKGGIKSLSHSLVTQSVTVLSLLQNDPL